MAKKEMKCPVCKLWIPTDSEYQVNVPNHHTKDDKPCKGSSRGPLAKRGFKK